MDQLFCRENIGEKIDQIYIIDLDKFNDGNYEYLERVLGVLILPGSFYYLDNDIILKLATFD